MSLLKVKDHSSLRRDDVTGAIVAVSNGEWYKAKQRQVVEQISKDRDEALKTAQQNICNVEREIAELKAIIEIMQAPKKPFWRRFF
jgi:uncharacterized protein YdaT